MNAMPYLNFYAIVSWTMGFLPIVFFFWAASYYSRRRRVASMVMLGSALMLFAFVGSVGFNMLASRYFGQSTFMEYAMVVNSLQTILHSCGVALFVAAAFADREPRSNDVSFENSDTPESANPYRAPVLRKR